MLRIILLFSAFFTTQIWANTSFKDDYAVWINPDNQFVVEVSDQELRPLYAYGDFSSNDNNTAPIGTGINPTVSEGLGYALLFAYAADDQKSFDKFLRFAWKAAQKYGCRGQANADTPCQQPVNLVPWMINEDGVPFMTTGTGAMDGNASVNYSSGSASDADFQIAWALHLAAQHESWQENTPPDLDYAEIFKAMLWDIAKFDINLANNLFVPGASWFEEGEKTFFPGYYTPQSFDIFAQHTTPHLEQKKLVLQNHDISITLHNSTGKTATAHETDNSSGTWTPGTPGDVAPHTSASYNFLPKYGDTGGSWIYVGWGQYDTNAATHLCTATFHYYPENSLWEAVSYDLKQCELKITETNTFAFTLYDPVVEDWLAVKEDNLKKIIAFQNQYPDLNGLMPNIADPHTMETKYNDRYGYDATRYPLWAGAYLLTQCSEKTAVFCENLQTSLTTLTDFFIKQGVIEAGSLPVDGYYYGPNALPHETTELAGPALNGPVLVAAHALNHTDLVYALLPRFNSYDLAKNKPDTEKPHNSSAYYEGALLMLSKAALEERL